MADKGEETGKPHVDQAASIDWDAIAKITGLSPEQIEKQKANWKRGPQTSEQVRQGALAERERREAMSDKPGGLTDQIKAKPKPQT